MATKLAELEAEKGELEARSTVLRESQQYKEVNEEDLRSLFGVFRKYIKERNVPEIKKFIGSYVEKVVVYKDYCEVFFCCVGAEKSEPLRLTTRVSRGQITRYYAA